MNRKAFLAWWMAERPEAYRSWRHWRTFVAMFCFGAVALWVFWLIEGSYSPSATFFIALYSVIAAGLVTLTYSFERTYREAWKEDVDGCTHNVSTMDWSGTMVCDDCGAAVGPPAPEIDQALTFPSDYEAWKATDRAHVLGINAHTIGKEEFAHGACSCGWKGPRRSTPQEAGHDAMHHKAEEVGG